MTKKSEKFHSNPSYFSEVDVANENGVLFRR